MDLVYSTVHDYINWELGIIYIRRIYESSIVMTVVSYDNKIDTYTIIYI